MISSYSYFFRAFYDWLMDNDANPRIMVDASKPGVRVPMGYVNEGLILISIYHQYIRDLNITATGISFYTRFKGKEEFVVVPYYAMVELVCYDTGLSIPLNAWLASIEVAFQQHQEIDENSIYKELAIKESEAASLLEDENDANKSSISFVVEDNEDAASSKTVEVNQPIEQEPVADQVEIAEEEDKFNEEESPAPNKSKKPDFSLLS